MDFNSGNIFIRYFDLNKAGEVREGHEHNFDHHTLCVAGRIKIEREHPDGKKDVKEQSAGELGFLIQKECKHTITALVDNTRILCIYAHRTPQGDVVQQWTGWPNAYV